MHLSARPFRPSSRSSVCAMPSPLASSPAAAEMPNRYRLGSDVVHHPVAPDAQPPQIRRPVRERLRRPRLIGEPGDCVEHLANPVGVGAEEPGRLVDRLGLPAGPGGSPGQAEPPQRLVVRYRSDHFRELDIKGGRHYTASQLLTGGFELRNTAARLGHGGATTLRHYADPVPEIGRRATSRARRNKNPKPR